MLANVVILGPLKATESLNAGVRWVRLRHLEASNAWSMVEFEACGSLEPWGAWMGSRLTEAIIGRGEGVGGCRKVAPPVTRQHRASR